MKKNSKFKALEYLDMRYIEDLPERSSIDRVTRLHEDLGLRYIKDLYRRYNIYLITLLREDLAFRSSVKILEISSKEISKIK
jgi:hypothetical protein